MDARRDKLGREEALKIKVSILIVPLLPVQSTGRGKLTRSQFSAVLGGSDLNSNLAARVEKSLPDSREKISQSCLRLAQLPASLPDWRAQNIAKLPASLPDLQAQNIAKLPATRSLPDWRAQNIRGQAVHQHRRVSV